MRQNWLPPLIALFLWSGGAPILAEEPPSLVPDELRSKFEGIDLNPANLVGKPGDAVKSGGSSTSTKPITPSPTTSSVENAQFPNVPVEVADLVWPMIDQDGNGSASDREAMAAVKPLRVAANSKTASDSRDTLRAAMAVEESMVVSVQQAILLIAKVRGQCCPTALRAREVLQQFDADATKQIESADVVQLLRPLGAVGGAISGQIGATFKSMDLNESKSVDYEEAMFSANALMRIRLATLDSAVANRSPKDWYKFVNAVAYLDMDCDNQVSPLEARGAGSIAAAFQGIDGNGDSFITVAELSGFQQRLDQQRLDLTATSGGCRSCR